MWRHPLDQRVAERVVVAREQHPLAASEGPAGPRHRQARLATARTAGDEHAPVHVERCQRPHTVVAQLVHPLAGAARPCPVVEVELGVRAQHPDDRLDARRADVLTAPAQAHQPVDRIGRIVEERARHELLGLDLRRQLATAVDGVGEHDGVLDAQLA